MSAGWGALCPRKSRIANAAPFPRRERILVILESLPRFNMGPAPGIRPGIHRHIVPPGPDGMKDVLSFYQKYGFASLIDDQRDLVLAVAMIEVAMR